MASRTPSHVSKLARQWRFLGPEAFDCRKPSHCHILQEADACGARIEYIDQEQSITVRRISESFKLTVRLLSLYAYRQSENVLM